MNYKILVIGFVALLAIGAGVTGIIKGQKEFKVEYKAEVPQTVFDDGRTQAGSPAQYWVDPAPALVWELTKSGTWRLIAYIVVALLAIYLWMCGTGRAMYNHRIFFAGLVLAAACWVGAYSSALENNTKKLTPAQYEAVKDNLPSLWSKESLIK